MVSFEETLKEETELLSVEVLIAVAVKLLEVLLQDFSQFCVILVEFLQLR